MSKIIRQNCHGDFLVTETFKTKNEDGTETIIPVPERVRIEYFTEHGNGKFVVIRNGTEFTSCSLSNDGNTLISHIALSQVYIGTGFLFHNVIETVEDPRFPGQTRNVPSPAKTNVELGKWVSDKSATISSEVILQSMIYGYSAYQLALLNGFVGSEEEYVNFPLDATAKAVKATSDAEEAILKTNTAINSADNAASGAIEAGEVARASIKTLEVVTTNAERATTEAQNALSSLRRGVDGGGANTKYGGCFVFDAGNANTI